MAIYESKTQSGLEKRLKLLRQQIYGKGSSEKLTYQHTNIPIPSGSPKSSESFRSDITYLHKDLFKILTLSSAAIGLQLVLFILSKNHILNLVFR